MPRERLIMQVCVFTEPHRGASYDDQVRFARHVEERGFHGFFRADHYQSMGSTGGLPGPTDAWVTLGAISQATSRLRLGTLVSSATFRLPGPMAIIVAQVDEMSRGRVEFGIGAGWYGREHLSYGIPFPPLGERFDLLTEQVEIITGLWGTPVGQLFTYEGKHYQLTDAPALPKPAQPFGPPLIIGGRGTRRTPELAARYATEFNAAFQSVRDAEKAFARASEAAERVGRAAAGRAPLRLSVGTVVACGRSDAEARRRASVLYEPNSALPSEDPVIGSPTRLVERIGQFSAIGTDRVYLRLTDLTDLRHLDLIADEVLPHVTP
jgi:F420-dependent oxidoreductase-like protein